MVRLVLGEGVCRGPGADRRTRLRSRRFSGGRCHGSLVVAAAAAELLLSCRVLPCLCVGCVFLPQIGTCLSLVYLVLKDAMAAWIPLVIEIAG